MKKPFIIFSVFIILVSVLVYSCGTKDDPPVPDHTTNITTISNTVTFHTFLYTLAFKTCGIVDTSSGKHFVMTGKDVGQNFEINIFFSDSVAPVALPLTYTVVPPTATTLSSAQCIITLTEPSVSAFPYVATGGTVNLSSSHGNIAVSFKNVPVADISDSTLTSTITGDWICP